jgi:hypothetical protein
MFIIIIVMPNGVVAWCLSSSKYVQAAVQNVQEYLKKNGDRKLKNKAPAPFEATYRADIYESLHYTVYLIRFNKLILRNKI